MKLIIKMKLIMLVLTRRVKVKKLSVGESSVIMTEQKKYDIKEIKETSKI